MIYSCVNKNDQFASKRMMLTIAVAGQWSSVICSEKIGDKCNDGAVMWTRRQIIVDGHKGTTTV